MFSAIFTGNYADDFEDEDGDIEEHLESYSSEEDSYSSMSDAKSISDEEFDQVCCIVWMVSISDSIEKLQQELLLQLEPESKNAVSMSLKNSFILTTARR